MPTLHITGASILFILSAVIGLWFSVGILPRYVRVYGEARRLPDPENRRLASGVHGEILSSELLRCLVHVLGLTVGLWSLFVQPTPVFFHDVGHQAFGLFVLCTITASQICTTANTLIMRHGYLSRRGDRHAKLLPSRDAAAAVLRRLRHIERRVKTEERRNDASEAKAQTAVRRADIAESDLEDHEGRLEVTEEVLHITHAKTVKKPGEAQ